MIVELVKIVVDQDGNEMKDPVFHIVHPLQTETLLCEVDWHIYCQETVYSEYDPKMLSCPKCKKLLRELKKLKTC